MCVVSIAIVTLSGACQEDVVYAMPVYHNFHKRVTLAWHNYVCSYSLRHI